MATPEPAVETSPPGFDEAAFREAFHDFKNQFDAAMDEGYTLADLLIMLEQEGFVMPDMIRMML